MNEYFSDKVITGISEVYVKGTGWISHQEYLKRLQQLAFKCTDNYEARDAFKKDVDLYNVNYKGLKKYPDGSKHVYTGTADITKADYDSMKAQTLIVRYDAGDKYPSGRQKRCNLDTVYVRGYSSALRLLRAIYRLEHKDIANYLVFSTSW